MENLKNWDNEMDVIYLYLRLYMHLFIRILLYFDGVKKKWKKKKKRKNKIQRQNFSSKISLQSYPWKLVILNINKFTRSDQFKSNPKPFNYSRANRLSGLIGEWLEESSCPDNKARADLFSL